MFLKLLYDSVYHDGQNRLVGAHFNTIPFIRKIKIRPYNNTERDAYIKIFRNF